MKLITAFPLECYDIFTDRLRKRPRVCGFRRIHCDRRASIRAIDLKDLNPFLGLGQKRPWICEAKAFLERRD